MPNPKTKAKQAPARSPKCFLRCSNEIILEIASYLGLQGLAVLLQASPDLQNVLHIPLYNLTALEYALNINHKACARLLFKKSTRVELENYLSIAANMGRLGTVQVFLEKGVGKNGTRVIDGRIPQHAVSKGNVECTRVLYKHGAWFEPEALLQSAVIYGHEAMVQFLLLERGGSCPGRTVYCRALEFSRWSILKLLLGSRVSAQGTKGDTALHFAAHIGDEKVVQLLLANGADASAPDEDGLRSLHYVAGAVSLHLIVYDDWVKKRVDLDKSHIRIIGMLLEKEACVSDTERFGLTAIDYAVRLDRESIVQCLKQGLEEE